MYETLPAFSGRALRRLPLLSAVALLAACDTDRPVAPQQRPLPTSVQPAVSAALSGGKLVIKVTDEFQSPLPFTAFSVSKSGQAALVVADNSASDNDPAWGVIELKGLSAGVYTACETTPSPYFGLPSPPCKIANITAGVTTQLIFVNLPAARVRVNIVDFVPNLVGGMQFVLKDSTNAVIGSFQENSSAADKDPAAGKLHLEIIVEGQYQLCATTPPAGYVFPSLVINHCRYFTATHGTNKQLADYVVYPLNSAYWHVTDGTVDANFNAVLIGPSTFKVSAASSPFTMDVVDNGMNDIHVALGKIAVKLPAPGLYSVCETLPPPGHWNAKPACKRITVVSGEPMWAEFWVNPEAQVPYPGAR